MKRIVTAYAPKYTRRERKTPAELKAGIVHAEKPKRIAGHDHALEAEEDADPEALAQIQAIIARMTRPPDAVYRQPTKRASARSSAKKPGTKFRDIDTAPLDGTIVGVR